MFLSSGEVSRARLLIGEESYVNDAPAKSEFSRESIEVSLFGEKLLQSAAVTLEEGDKIKKRIVVVSLLVAAVAVVLQTLLPLVVLPLYLLIEKGVLESRSKKRVEDFDKDYTAFLLSLASGVKTGLDPLVALTTAGHLFTKDSEMQGCITKLNESLERGKSEEEAIRAFAADIAHPDLRLFRTAFILARKEGSSLAECLQRLARVTRQRQSFRRKILSAVAMQKLSAFGIGGCAIVISIIQVSGNPQAIQTALAHPMGSKMLAVGAFLILFGIVWMLRMAKARLM
ncbi:MAG: type II secretion system F family protein [Bdellovibrionales bacterium]|nr:type II secretion system F family protein [Bdellovibrionales bacterium]